jgi:hypothetical protein
MSARYNRGQKKAPQAQYTAPISNNFVSANATQNVVTPVAPTIPPPAPAFQIKDEGEVNTDVQEGKPKWMGIKKKLSAKVGAQFLK